MDPDLIVNRSTVCLFSLKGIFSLLPGVNLTAGGAAVTLIFGLGYYMGIITLADAFTGQKTIRVIRSHTGLQRINRDNRFDYVIAMVGGFFWTFFGVFCILFAW